MATTLKLPEATNLIAHHARYTTRIKEIDIDSDSRKRALYDSIKILYNILKKKSNLRRNSVTGERLPLMFCRLPAVFLRHMVVDSFQATREA